MEKPRQFPGGVSDSEGHAYLSLPSERVNRRVLELWQNG